MVVCLPDNQTWVSAMLQAYGKRCAYISTLNQFRSASSCSDGVVGVQKTPRPHPADRSCAGSRGLRYSNYFVEWTTLPLTKVVITSTSPISLDGISNMFRSSTIRSALIPTAICPIESSRKAW